MSSNGSNADTSPLIELEGVTKVFYTDEVETHALADIHLEIPEGAFFSVAGPSGCGKSTLLSLLGLLDTPTGGEYLLDGQPVADLTASQRARIRNRHIGFVFQAFNLIGDLTVYENVELPLTYREGVSASERKERALKALERVGMSHRQGHYPAQLSGGQQQRVAVARAVVGDPLIVLADEPTGNLDERASRGIFRLIRDINANGTAVVMATHNLDLVRQGDYRTIELEQGAIVFDSSVDAQVAS